MLIPFIFQSNSAAERIAATVDISAAVNRWFRRSSSASESGIWGVILLSIVALWIGLYYWDRSRKNQKNRALDRNGLFLQLCDLHRLGHKDRSLLKKAVAHQRLENPGVIFVDPRILQEYAYQQPMHALGVQDLLGRLFGDTLIQEIVEGTNA